MIESQKFGLFEVTGVELEYMVVHKQTLEVLPIVDEIFKEKAGEYTSEIDNGIISWSNELTAHVVELKTNGPAKLVKGLDIHFIENVRQINQMLEKHQAMMLPGAVHPLMDPFMHSQIWKHKHHEVYDFNNRLFDCKGHGWSNVQSTHINLPFKNDDEFARLHAAIRLLLPILPGLSASSPILDGKLTGYLDSRMEHYRQNKVKIPILSGKIIPEMVYTKAAYQQVIFDPIQAATSPYFNSEFIDSQYLNSRGAIARFDRGSIEIRVLDIQEAPLMDIATVAFIKCILQAMVGQRWVSHSIQSEWSEDVLQEILLEVIKSGEKAIIQNKEYLNMFGLNQSHASLSELYRHLYKEVKDVISAPYQVALEKLLLRGSLATRIILALEGNMSPKKILKVYKSLATCLAENKVFAP